MREHDLGTFDDEPPIGPEQITAEALDALRDVLDWSATPAHWETISPIIESIADALARGDLSALHAATIELDLASPYRVIKVGDEEERPPSKKLREQVVYLVHTMEPDDADGAEGSA
ncbi:CATRA system-associated protein [Streptosporangium sp. NPDC002524]|uniref:CATRA system-associated protein n=1 Tax=Streptosporangium sp. NPDC002524 TaxID=3154537 RepID=UPI003323A008